MFFQDMGVDNSVIPPGTYVKVSGNLRSFQVRTCVQLMKTSIIVLFYMRLSYSVNGIVALFNYSNIISCALCSLSNDIHFASCNKDHCFYSSAGDC